MRNLTANKTDKMAVEAEFQKPCLAIFSAVQRFYKSFEQAVWNNCHHYTTSAHLSGCSPVRSQMGIQFKSTFSNILEK